MMNTSCKKGCHCFRKKGPLESWRAVWISFLERTCHSAVWNADSWQPPAVVPSEWVCHDFKPIINKTEKGGSTKAWTLLPNVEFLWHAIQSPMFHSLRLFLPNSTSSTFLSQVSDLYLGLKAFLAQSCFFSLYLSQASLHFHLPHSLKPLAVLSLP